MAWRKYNELRDKKFLSEFEKRKKGGNPMEKRYEIPELTMIGEANEVVMGSAGSGLDFPYLIAGDFEFEQD